MVLLFLIPPETGNDIRPFYGCLWCVDNFFYSFFFHYYYFIAISIIIWRVIDLIKIKDFMFNCIWYQKMNDVSFWGEGGLDIKWSSLLKTSLVSDVKWNDCFILLKLEKKTKSICILEIRRHCDIVTCAISVYRL